MNTLKNIQIQILKHWIKKNVIKAARNQKLFMSTLGFNAVIIYHIIFIPISISINHINIDIILRPE